MIIAEIGLNHLGSPDLVRGYISSLINTDVDTITLQVREPEYYTKNPHLKLCDNTYIAAAAIVNNHKKLGIAIGDPEYIDFFESIGVSLYKVIRNDITNIDLIDRLAQTGKPVIVSTGLSSDQDISNFIKHIGNNKNFRLNHTQLSYNIEDCNLKAIQSMREKYGLEISFGSHCDNYLVLYMALCYEPSDILFYVKLDQPDMAFPDSRHAIFLNDVHRVASNLKRLLPAIGDGEKQKMVNKMRQS